MEEQYCDKVVFVFLDAREDLSILSPLLEMELMEKSGSCSKGIVTARRGTRVHATRSKAWLPSHIPSHVSSREMSVWKVMRLLSLETRPAGRD